MIRLLLPLLIATLGASPAEEGWKPLLNGKDISGWETWLARPHRSSVFEGLAKNDKGDYIEALGLDRDPHQNFSIVVEDGRPALRISGEVFGGISTKEEFENYHFRAEFKWGQKKWPPRDGATTQRDSGLLYHVHAAPGAEGRTWARSIELQIQERDVGDLYAVGSAISVRAKVRPGSQPADYIYDPAGTWTYFSQIAGQSGRCIKQPDNEKPSGEWNTVELVCFGFDCIHIVNGKVVMRLYSPMRIDTPVPTPITSGPIILQSEGAEVFYRDINVRSITAIPPEYAA